MTVLLDLVLWRSAQVQGGTPREISQGQVSGSLYTHSVVPASPVSLASGGAPSPDISLCHISDLWTGMQVLPIVLGLCP